MTKFTPNRRRLEAGDRVIFYLGKPECSFEGEGTLQTACVDVPAAKRAALAEGYRFSGDLGLYLKDIKLWKTPIGARPLVADLEFVAKKEYWGAYFQGGVIELSEKDLKMILERQRKG